MTLKFREPIYFINSITKRKYKEIKDLTHSELLTYCSNSATSNIEYYPYVMSYDLVNPVLELGSNWDNDYLKPFLTPVFTNTETSTKDKEFSILSKEGLLEIIKDQHQRISRFYTALRGAEKETIEAYLEEREEEWSRLSLTPYNLDQTIPSLSRSKESMYSIFDLVKLHKEFNYKTKLLIISAH